MSTFDRLATRPSQRRHQSLPTNRTRRAASGRRAKPGVERLEQLMLLSGNVISGYVYNDVNNNGIKETGEGPIANSTIQLRNSSNVVVGNATTNTNGYYQFNTDSTIDTTPKTESFTQSIPLQNTTFNKTLLLTQFDPALGTLTSVDVTAKATITDHITIENLSTSSSATFTGQTHGSVTLTGPGIPNQVTNVDPPLLTFVATPFDGVIDFGGTSGHDFGVRTNTNSSTAVLNDAASLAAYTGTSATSQMVVAVSNVTFTFGGNVIQGISTQAAADVSVVYHYIPSNALHPGNYVIVQTPEVVGYLDGLEAKNGVPIPGSAGGPDTIPVTLTNTDVPNNNFGELLPGSLSGFVYVDANNNGIKDTGETPIVGVTLNLSGTNDLGASVTATTTTAVGTGAYSFGNLRPGSYTVTEIQPAGYTDGLDAKNNVVIAGSNTTDVIPAIPVVQGADSPNNTFGEIKPGSLSGFVYVDANNNGIKDTGETPIAGVTVKLSGPSSATTTTAADGSYSFGNLLPGSYTVTETQPAGFLDGLDAKNNVVIAGSNTTDVIAAIPVVQGADSPNNTFGEIKPGSLSGFVYVDANNNGIKDTGETPIAGVTVTLSGPSSATTTTAADGSYSFGNLLPGSYTVTETQPAGFLDGLDAKNNVVIAGSNTTDVIPAIPVVQGADSPNNTFGEIKPGSLSGFVYVDANNNGIKDTGETPIAGVTVKLSGPSSATTTTAADGSYSFGNLLPGSYTVTETQPAGYTDGLDAKNNVVIAGSNTTDVIPAIPVVQGADSPNNTFGELLVVRGSISGTKFLDLTGNGFSADDTPLGGVTINLYGSKDGSGNLSTLVATATTATTGAVGTYAFNNLAAGTYYVQEQVPSGFVQTGPTNLSYYTVTVTNGGSSTGINFVDAQQCTADEINALKNVKYTDTTAGGGPTQIDGLRNNTNQNDTVSVTFTYSATAAEESHQYTLVTYTAPAASFDANTASQQQIYQVQTVTVHRGQTVTLTVQNPNCYYQVDFVCGAAIDHFGPAGSNIFYHAQNRFIDGDNGGCQPCAPGTITGFVYVDANNNGYKDSNEAGIAGAKVTLTGTDYLGHSVNTTAVTGSNGGYAFSGLLPGKYTLTQAQVAGYTDGKDTAGKVNGLTTGTAGHDVISAIDMIFNGSGTDFNFGEIRASTCPIKCGDTATIGFWNSCDGQSLIKNLNGGSCSTSLGHWLATNLPNLCGSLAGKSNADIASIDQYLFSCDKTGAQVLATALSVYVTSSQLAGGNYAACDGFNVTSSGIGANCYNVGCNGAAFGVANNTSLSLLALLTKVDGLSSSGKLWNGNGTLTCQGNAAFTDINRIGQICSNGGGNGGDN